MDAHLIDADGNPLPPLAQRDMFPPIRLIRPADQTIADLRAVLAPLLDDPWEIVGWTLMDEPESVCRFCCAPFGASGVRDRPHHPDCPVRHRDELLGR